MKERKTFTLTDLKFIRDRIMTIDRRRNDAWSFEKIVALNLDDPSSIKKMAEIQKSILKERNSCIYPWDEQRYLQYKNSQKK